MSMLESTKPDCTIQLILIGESMVGKTCILLRYTDDSFTHVHMTTIGVENKSRVVEVDDKRVNVQLWDTAGQERYRAIASRIYKGVDGIILVYDTTSYESFEKVGVWIEQMENNTTKTLPIVLVGNKWDLEDQRDVPTEEGQKYAEELGYPFMEVSALSKEGIDEMFYTIIKEILPAKLKQKENKGMSAFNIIFNPE